ncbi:MAG: nucleoside recognition protein [Prevotellaceae bacterium]|jgi:spore maturation protein SpmB|nr:nucleoside recognition protein [Prevotellaceae bacterium]
MRSSEFEYLPIPARAINAIKSAINPAMKTAWWMVRLTVTVSLAVTVFQYFGIVAWLAKLLNPLFNLVGLPGESALVFISGYFVNIYSAITVVVTLDIGYRAITILAVMCLCSHNMIIETAVQKKTGSSALRMVLLRTTASFVSAFILNWILPAETIVSAENKDIITLPLKDIAINWSISTSVLAIKMFVLILSLNILQKLLAEFGVIRLLSKLLRPILKIFGLPAKTSFLWIVANILGLAYGAAVMIEETEQGKISKNDVDLLNHHIAISHSNLEDISLFLSIGASLWWMLIIRWILAAIAVWLRRMENNLRQSKYRLPFKEQKI